MKYSYNWLKELSETKLSPEKLADLLTMHAFEFEELKKERKETQLVFDILANREFRRGHRRIRPAFSLPNLSLDSQKHSANTIQKALLNYLNSFRRFPLL